MNRSEDEDDLLGNPRQGGDSASRSASKQEAGPSGQRQGSPTRSTNPSGASALPSAGVHASALAGRSHGRRGWGSHRFAKLSSSLETSGDDDEVFLPEDSSECRDDETPLHDKTMYDWPSEPDGPPLVSDASWEVPVGAARWVDLTSRPDTDEAARPLCHMKIDLIGSFHGEPIPFLNEENIMGIFRDEESGRDISFELHMGISKMLVYPLDCMAPVCTEIPANDTTAPTSEIGKDDSDIIFLYSSLIAHVISPQKLNVHLYTDDAEMGNFVGRFTQRHRDLSLEPPPNIFQSNSRFGAWADSLRIYSRINQKAKFIQTFFLHVHRLLERIFKKEDVGGNVRRLDDFFDEMNVPVRRGLDRMIIEVPHSRMVSLGEGVLNNLRELIKALKRDEDWIMNELGLLKQAVWKYVITAKMAQDNALRLSELHITPKTQAMFTWSNRICQAMFLCAFPPPPPPEVKMYHYQASRRQSV